MTPAVFQADRHYIFAFTANTAVPKEYFKRFAMVETDMEKIRLEIEVVSQLLGVELTLLIDPFGDEK